MNLRSLPWIPIGLGAGVALFVLSRRQSGAARGGATLPPTGVQNPELITPGGTAIQADRLDFNRYANAVRQPGVAKVTDLPAYERAIAQPLPAVPTCPPGQSFYAYNAFGVNRRTDVPWIYDPATGDVLGKCF